MSDIVAHGLASVMFRRTDSLRTSERKKGNSKYGAYFRPITYLVAPATAELSASSLSEHSLRQASP